MLCFFSPDPVPRSTHLNYNMMDQKNQKAVISLLFVGVLMGALDISIVGPAIPSIENYLKLGPRFSGWIFSIYVLFNLIGRAIQGFGASGIFPVASALVGDIFPPEKRGRILGLIGAVFGLAFLMGPFIAGVMLHYFEWHFLFIINLPVSLVLIYYSFKVLPSEPNKNVSRIDWGGIIALISFFVFMIIEKRAKDPVIEFSFFSNRQIVIAGIIALATGTVQACFVFIPKFVVQNFLVTPSAASFMLTPFVLATAIGSPVFGKLIDKYGAKKIVITGLFLLAAGFFLLSLTGSQKLIYYISGVLIGLGLSVLSGSSLRYIILNNTSAEDRATSQGLLTILISIGQITGTAVIGLLLASMTGSKVFGNIFTGVSILLLVMILLSFGLESFVSPKPARS